MQGRRNLGRPPTPQIFSDQLTLSQLGGWGQIMTPGLSDFPTALLGSFFASRSLAHYGMMVPFGHYLMLFAEQMAVSLLLEFPLPACVKTKEKKTL